MAGLGKDSEKSPKAVTEKLGTDGLDNAVSDGEKSFTGKVRKGKKSKNPHDHCLSCNAPIVGNYCYNCGQKDDDYRRNIFSLAGDLVSETLDYDSRMWRTLGHLTVTPGTVPSGYAHGKRTVYTPPIRLFLVVSFLFFLTLTFTSTNFLEVSFGKSKIGEPGEVGETVQPLSEKLNEELQQAIEEAGEDMPDQIREKLEKLPDQIGDAGWTEEDGFVFREEDGLYSLDFDLKFFSRGIEGKEEVEQIDIKKYVNQGDNQIEPGSIPDKAINGFIELIENPDGFNAIFNAWLPRVMFLMMPALAIMMALFFRGREALMYDHLVLSIYFHSVGFLFVTASLLISYLGISSSVAGLTTLAIFVYFLLALKRAFRRGWFKTIFSGVFITFFYMLLMLCAVLFITWEALMGVA